MAWVGIDASPINAAVAVVDTEDEKHPERIVVTTLGTPAMQAALARAGPDVRFVLHLLPAPEGLLRQQRPRLALAPRLDFVPFARGMPEHARVWIEAPTAHGGNQRQQMAEQMDAVKRALAPGLVVQEVTPGHVKAWWTGKRNASKAEMYAAFRARLPHVDLLRWLGLRPGAVSDHPISDIVDAVAVVCCGLEADGQAAPVGGLPEPMPVARAADEPPPLELAPLDAFRLRNTLVGALTRAQDRLDATLLDLLRRRVAPGGKRWVQFGTAILRQWLDLAIRLTNVTSRRQGTAELVMGPQVDYTAKLTSLHRRFYRVFHRDKVGTRQLPVRVALDDALGVYLWFYVVYCRPAHAAQWVFTGPRGKGWGNEMGSDVRKYLKTIAPGVDVGTANDKWWYHHFRGVVLASFGALVGFDRARLAEVAPLFRHTAAIMEKHYLHGYKHYRSALASTHASALRHLPVPTLAADALVRDPPATLRAPAADLVAHAAAHWEQWAPAPAAVAAPAAEPPYPLRIARLPAGDPPRVATGAVLPRCGRCGARLVVDAHGQLKCAHKGRRRLRRASGALAANCPTTAEWVDAAYDPRAEAAAWPVGLQDRPPARAHRPEPMDPAHRREPAAVMLDPERPIALLAPLPGSAHEFEVAKIDTRVDDDRPDLPVLAWYKWGRTRYGRYVLDRARPLGTVPRTRLLGTMAWKYQQLDRRTLDALIPPPPRASGRRASRSSSRP